MFLVAAPHEDDLTAEAFVACNQMVESLTSVGRVETGEAMQMNFTVKSTVSTIIEQRNEYSFK